MTIDICQLPYESAKLAEALQTNDFEFHFIGADQGANGCVMQLQPLQAVASPKLFLCVGGSSDIATVTTALASAAGGLAAQEAVQSNQAPLNKISSSEVSDVAAGLIKYFADLEVYDTAAADKLCVGFCVQGLPVKDVVFIELCVRDVSAMTDVILFQAGPAQVLSEPISLGSNGKIISSGTTEIALTTDVLNIALSNKLVFGALKVLTSAALVLASGDLVILKIKAKI